MARYRSTEMAHKFNIDEVHSHTSTANQILQKWPPKGHAWNTCWDIMKLNWIQMQEILFIWCWRDCEMSVCSESNKGSPLTWLSMASLWGPLASQRLRARWRSSWLQSAVYSMLKLLRWSTSYLQWGTKFKKNYSFVHSLREFPFIHNASG